MHMRLQGNCHGLAFHTRTLAPQEASWGPLMSLVGEGINGEGRAWAKEKAGIKERWREINTALTELRDAQTTWTIPDAALKANMKDAVAEDFLPVYKVGRPFCDVVCVVRETPRTSWQFTSLGFLVRCRVCARQRP